MNLLQFNSQTGISKGKVLRMGKGFTLDNIDGQDLTNLFHDAFKRKVSKFYMCQFLLYLAL